MSTYKISIRTLLAFALFLLCITSFSLAYAHEETQEERNARAKEIRTTINERQEEREVAQATRRNEQEKMQEEREAEREERTKERVAAIINHIIGRTSATIARFEDIIERLETRIDKLEERGLDVSDAETSLVGVQNNIRELKTLIDNFDDNTDLENTENKKETIKEIRDQLYEIKSLIFETRRHLLDAVEYLKIALREAGLEGGVSDAVSQDNRDAEDAESKTE